MIESGRSELRLKPFLIDLEALRGLVETMGVPFGVEEKGLEISIELPNRHLRFASVDELVLYKRLPPRVTKVHVTVHSTGHRPKFLSVSFGGALFEAAASAHGGDETWCRAAVEGVRIFLDDHRAWHWWIRKSFLWSLLLWATVLVFPTWAMLGRSPSTTHLQLIVLTVLGSIMLLSMVSIVASGQYLPPGTLEINPDRVWYRRREGGLLLLLGVLALVVAIAQLLRT